MLKISFFSGPSNQIVTQHQLHVSEFVGETCQLMLQLFYVIHSLQVNQIGTVTESIQAALDSKAAGWGVMVSHRSGETEDNFIADLSVGLASGQVVYP